ncbi:protein-methionine-sulfoxide reductase heme-binding subunit MsrQ [Paracoccus sp. (in: a-proteobacteria)]|uniref:sulfite oxidase heme-binding subunit YedZ n=1 Tax=Paracoccus sp. TaxID=267 RepID=UPI00321FF886
MARFLNPWLRRIPARAVWPAGLLPLALLAWEVATGQAGVDPVRAIEHRLGRTAIYFLLATLAVTPLLRLTRLNLMRQRQALGLLCFTYLAGHLLAWVYLDMGLLWGQMLRDVVKRPYLLFGMAGFLLLLALALSSNRQSRRALGSRWFVLHRLIYPASILGGLHWVWSLKVWDSWALAVLAVILLLILLRLPMILRRVGVQAGISAV